MRTEIEKILHYDRGGIYYQFNNSDGKIWLMPKRHIRIALLLYQPSYWKGKLLKKILSIPCIVKYVISVLQLEVLQCDLQENLKNLLYQLFETDELDFSIFFGTPSAHQKVTIQLSKREKILGYCKVTTQSDIWGIFQREYSLLKFLHKKGICNIPEGLFCGKFNNGLCLFVQSTTKSQKSRYPHEWLPIHERFLANLNNKTIQRLPFKNTDFYASLHSLEQRLDCFSNEVAEVINIAQSYVKSIYNGKMVEFSVFHGDFTPWNMYLEKGELCVFDWEYALMTCPPGLDYYHFFTQTQIHNKHHHLTMIWKDYQNIYHRNDDYLCYLLLIISIYIKRESKETLKTISSCVQLWIDLIKLLEIS